MEIVRATKIDKGSLKFTLDVKIKKWGNFVIHSLQIFEKEGRKWLAMPSKKIEVGTSGARYLAHCRFEDRATHDAFAEKVFETFEKWLAAGNRPQEYQPKEPPVEAPGPSYGAGSNDSYNEAIPF